MKDEDYYNAKTWKRRVDNYTPIHQSKTEAEAQAQTTINHHNEATK